MAQFRAATLPGPMERQRNAPPGGNGNIPGTRGMQRMGTVSLTPLPVVPGRVSVSRGRPGQPTPAPVETWDTINAIGLGGRGMPRPYTDLSPLIFLGVHIRRPLRFFALGVSWHYPRGLAPTQIYRTYCAWDGASPPVAFLWQGAGRRLQPI